MKTIALVLLTVAAPSFAAPRRSPRSRPPKSYSAPAPSYSPPVRVERHNRRSGALVEPHRRTAPDASKMNNYGTKGNYNPYTGKEGTREPRP